MNHKNTSALARLLPEGERSREAMSEEAAAIVAQRVMFQLMRGAYDMTVLALDDGWKSYQAERAGLPTGPALLDVWIGTAVNDERLTNLLEREGVTTVKQFLADEPEKWIGGRGIGNVTLEKLRALRERLLAGLHGDSEQ